MSPLALTLSVVHAAIGAPDVGAELERLANAVDSARLQRSVEVLQSAGSTPGTPGTRVSGTEGERAAREWIALELGALGLSPERTGFRVTQVFEPRKKVFSENLTVHFGPEEGPRWVVIAHLDSRGAQDRADARARGWDWGATPAPGADDNGSGTAALLELARLLVDTRQKTALSQGVDVVFAGAEELAMVDRDVFMRNYGGEMAAEQYAREGVQVAGAISADMFLRARPFGKSFRVYEDGRWASTRISSALRTAAAVVEPAAELRVIVDPSFTWSDHGAFWAYGWGGVLLIEDDFHHERYHRAADFAGRDDSFYSWSHLTAGTRILVAAVWLLAARSPSSSN